MKIALLLFVLHTAINFGFAQNNKGMSAPNLNIKMVSVLVNDPIAAHKFYTETLGFESHTYMPEAQLSIVVAAGDKNGTTILLEPKGKDFGKDFQEAVFEKGYPIIILGSKDVQAEYELLLAKGVKFKQKPTKTDWGIVATFDDTCGNYVQLHQDLE